MVYLFSDFLQLPHTPMCIYFYYTWYLRVYFSIYMSFIKYTFALLFNRYRESNVLTKRFLKITSHRSDWDHFPFHHYYKRCWVKISVQTPVFTCPIISIEYSLGLGLFFCKIKNWIGCSLKFLCLRIQILEDILSYNLIFLLL